VEVLRSVIVALVYREVTLFKRHFSEYLIIWFIPSLLSLAVVLLPMTMFKGEEVIRRVNYVLGAELDFNHVIMYSLAISSIISLTLVIIDDAVNTLYHEKNTTGVLQMILETTSLKTYLIALALVKPPLLTLLSTMYLAIALPLAGGFEGLTLYLTLLPSLLISSTALGMYALIISILVSFRIRISRPWTISNTLIPALLAGSGLYIPLKLVPLFLRIFAYTAPIPQECEIIRILAFKGLSVEILIPITLMVMLMAIYLSINTPMAHLTDLSVRRGGT